MEIGEVSMCSLESKPSLSKSHCPSCSRFWRTHTAVQSSCKTSSSTLFTSLLYRVKQLTLPHLAIFSGRNFCQGLV
uniref:Putative ovule protein n=1 Tax=Solanum chacoense TaxID=4108 RepID=A0A0V0GPY4_SOLCH